MTILTATPAQSAPAPAQDANKIVGAVAPRVLAIGGTDPSGGAGIQADLKAIAANGGYGMAVVTALVAQNTTGVEAMHIPPADFLTEQLNAVSTDVTIDAVKIGMLFNREIISTVGRWLSRAEVGIVVLDPVMVSTSGHRLLDSAAKDAIFDLFDLVDLVTPNVPELAELLDEPLARTWDEALSQAQRLAKRHGVSVLAKGGHLTGSPLAQDALVDGASGTVTPFSCDRIDTVNTHGTGCSLSAAVATLRVSTGGWAPAVSQAKDWLTESIKGADALQVGAGAGPVSHFNQLWARPLTQRIVTAQTVADHWWDEIGQVREEIDNLEFIQKLAAGSLDQAAFDWYLAQDALYLRDYSRALAQASALAPTADEQTFWAKSAHDAIAAEMELHGHWLPADDMFNSEQAPTTSSYVNHLLATAARGSYPELVAALLPCFWIYFDVGNRLIQHATPDNPFAAWLLTYGDPAFESSTQQAISIVTSVAASVDEPTRSRMQQAFNASARAELVFFAAPLETRR